MLKHFENVQSPLKSIRQYQTLTSQESRFLSAKWSSAYAHSLWHLWNDSTFISPAQKTALNAVEPFDEWEDFALFAAHYFFLLARSNSSSKAIPTEECLNNFELNFDCDESKKTEDSISSSKSGHFFSKAASESGGHRRFGSILLSPSGTFGHQGGIGIQARLTTTHVYKLHGAAETSISLPPPEIVPRMCHTVTALPRDSYILVGGRTSPDQAMSDCWLCRDAQWAKIQEIPMPLYRHCAVAIGLETSDPGVLVFGGRSRGGMVLNSWYLWRTSTGWIQLRVSGAEIQPRFGAVMSSVGPSNGIILGGMTDDGSIASGIWNWSIRNLPSDPSVELTEYDTSMLPSVDAFEAIYRFGACLTWSSFGLLIIGGISKHFLPQKKDVMCLTQRTPENFSTLRPSELSCISYAVDSARPLLVGHSACSFQDSIIIAGGGAICFSFGSYWNRNVLILDSGGRTHPDIWRFDSFQTRVSSLNQQHMYESTPMSATVVAKSPNVRNISRLQIETSYRFTQAITDSQPFIMEGLDIGPCQREWTLESLKAKIGPLRSVRN